MNKEKGILSISLVALTAASIMLPALGQGRTKRSDPNTYYRAPHSMAGKMIVLPIGTTFEGRLNKTLSSAKSHMGESFGIVLAAPVLANGIDVVIPAGSEIVGEVVEAISSRSQPKIKHAPLPRGKLRIQITQLRTPDGTSFPLVANLIGEEDTSKGRRRGLQTNLGSSVGYVGTSEAFEAIAPGANRYGKQYTSQRGPDYVKKREFLAHEIYGNGADDYKGADDRRIRSLVLRKMDLWMDTGAPLTVKLQAPLRLSLSPHNEGVPVGAVEQGSGEELPMPSGNGAGGGSDIPPLTQENMSAPPMRRAQAPDPMPQQQAPANPPPAPQTPPPPPQSGSPSSDF